MFAPSVLAQIVEYLMIVPILDTLFISSALLFPWL